MADDLQIAEGGEALTNEKRNRRCRYAEKEGWILISLVVVIHL
jgi:hypothetical protein